MLDLLVFNRDLDVLGEISEYDSLEIELDYKDVSKMVIRVESRKENLELLKKGNILVETSKMDYGYIIEHFSLVLENGNKIIEIFAYSLNHLLSFRTLPKQQNYKGTADSVIRDYVKYNFIETETERVLTNLVLSNNNITLPETESMNIGGSVLEYCLDISNEYDSSIRVNINHETKMLEFEVWQGLDRSIQQQENERVMFSTQFDNVFSYEYYTSDIDLKNVVYVLGEGEGKNRPSVKNGDFIGFDRREFFVDASSLSKNYEDENGEEVNMSEQQYLEALLEHGKESLSELVTVESYESTVDDIQYVIGRDYWLGDLVTFYDEDLDITLNVRVNKITITSDKEGVKYEPSFGTGIPNKLKGAR